MAVAVTTALVTCVWEVGYWITELELWDFVPR